MKTIRRHALGVVRYLPPRVLHCLMWGTQAKFLMTTAVILIHRDQVLLVYHRYRRRYPWGLVTGFVECGESVETAALREVAEETGIRLSAVMTPPVLVQMAFVQPHQFELAYAVVLGRNVPATVGPSADGEISHGLWFPVSHLPRALAPAQRALIRQTAAQRSLADEP